jgi:hypothetical protein
MRETDGIGIQEVSATISLIFVKLDARHTIPYKSHCNFNLIMIISPSHHTLLIATQDLSNPYNLFKIQHEKIT